LTWAIGDIQGCFDSFEKLLKEINFNPSIDRLWLVGDLVNRGNKSLEVLEYVYENQNIINIVLGNHDISLIAAYFGLKKSNPTIEPILNSPKVDILINWLREQPFLHIDYNLGYAMAHAGIAPNFELGAAKYYNDILQDRLKSQGAKEWLRAMLSKDCDHFISGGSNVDIERYALSSFTRMRYCYKNGYLDFKQKGSPSLLDRDDLYPWFDCPTKVEKELKIVFGHWSTLGFLDREDIVALDTGCVWGRELSAYCLESNDVISISCQNNKETINKS